MSAVASVNETAVSVINYKRLVIYLVALQNGERY